MEVVTSNVINKHRVLVKRDSFIQTFHELYCSIWVLGDAFEEAAFASILSRAGCYKADSMEKADIVIFTGGSDINPAFYGEEPIPGVVFNEKRDAEDLAAYKLCYELGITMVGIERKSDV